MPRPNLSSALPERVLRALECGQYVTISAYSQLRMTILRQQQNDGA